MALQTNVFRDGQWRTETVNISTIIKGSGAVTAADPAKTMPKSPSCGILTRTLVESPVVHWILPARLRSARLNDVVFIGDHYVQVNELREGGELHEVLRKNDFGSRIQNALVIGNVLERPDTAGEEDFGYIKSEDREVSIGGFPGTVSNTGPVLPPHLLFLVLESGAFVFLFLRQKGNRVEFVTSHFQHHRRRLGSLGFHVAVDPMSQYIAVADVENKFVVYELEGWSTMGEQYVSQGTISPIKSYCPRPVQGVIHKMEFLHPRPEDDFHVILMLIMVRHGISTMVLYDWELGDDVVQLLSEEKHGHRLPREHRMPLFIVPLTVRSSFLIVSETSIGVCKDPLEGPPQYEIVDPGKHATTIYHHGARDPLWTAWDRPVRRRGYYEVKDNIYLAREDGVIVFLELNSTDILGATMNVGCCSCNISTAFTTMYDAFTDVAIVAGDSGPGMICQLRPRMPLVELGTIPNWSPTLDFVTTDEFTSWDQHTVSQSRRGVSTWKEKKQRQWGCDRIFCISGKGIQGAVTELRHGISANIGLEISYGTPIKQSWIFEAQLPRVGPGYYLLLALPSSSDMLQISRDSLDACQPDSDTPQFEMSSRTLAAAQCSDQMVVQVTEVSIVLVTPTQSFRYEYHALAGFKDKAVNAVVGGTLVAVSTHGHGCSHAHLFDFSSGDVKLTETFQIDGEITALALGEIGQQVHIMAGLWQEGQAYLALFCPALQGGNGSPTLIRLGAENEDSTGSSILLEMVTSIVVVDQTESATSLAMGTRSGHLVTLMLSGNAPFQSFICRESFGAVALRVMPVTNPRFPRTVLACCDDTLLILRDFDASRTGRFKTRERVIANDAKDPTLPSPPIAFADVLRSSIGQSDHASMLLVAEDRILLTEILPKPKLVPRHFPLGGTPTKMLFSHILQCLVVAMKTDTGQTTIAFVDPDTGRNVSQPSDKDSSPLSFINGLGNTGSRIHDLVEWLYEKEGKMWLFIVVTTKDGQLLIVSTERIETRDAQGRALAGVRHWTRYKKKVSEEPVYAAVGDGADLIFCAGKVLHWEVLDLFEKRLKPKKTFELPSPAISLRVVKGRIYVLTTQHSLIIIDHKSDVQQNEMTLVHNDVGSRRATHYIDMGDSCDGMPAWPVTLICEQTHEVSGVWVPWKEPEKEFEVVFEAKLPAGLRRLRRGHVRPKWSATEARFGHIPSTIDGADVLGLALDGSVYHMVLLSLEAWRFLSFVQTLSVGGHPQEQDANGEDDSSNEDEGLGRQVDGDILQQYLENKALVELIGSDSIVAERLCKRLDDIDGGKWTDGFKGLPRGTQADAYLQLARDVLEYYLAPVL